MSPEHPTPGTDTAAATARAEESGAPPPPATTPAAPTRTPAPTTKAESAPTPAGETAAAPTAPSATTEPAETHQAPEARAEGHGVAAAIATTPETRTVTAVDKGRPRTPILAGAAFVGAALVAIPVLLMGSANDEEPRNPATTPVAGSADTVLNPEPAPAALDDYVAVKPTPSPSPTEQKNKIAPPKAAPAPASVAPSPAPRTSAPAEKPKASPKPKPKPKAASKPNWGSQTVSATSSIGVGQSWATNRIRMTMQQDGNLVVYNEQNKPIWAAMTFGENHRAIFQPDGNLVIHNGDDRAIWASKTHDFGGARMVLRPDAKVVIVHNGRVVWST
ncbi:MULTISPECIES: mannose-binding protein [Streptomyces]|uniref:mannose-binding protein n=1 Tax=Streptomyces TaxID=1883 RepID=UPI0004C50FF9|nr:MULTISPECIES: mannose-binding protein [Streptomyces]RPK81285.1 D-mannose binding lectin [Streptomyces sp. ADI98-10]